MLVTAAGLGMLFMPLTLVALSRVSDRDAGLASSLPNVGQQVGGSIGLALLGTVAWTVVANTARHSAAAAAAAARAAEITAHGWAAGFERTGQAAGIVSRRACQWAVLIVGDPARAGDLASVNQAMRTRPLLPRSSGARPGPAGYPAPSISALASSPAGLACGAWAPARSARLTGRRRS